MTDEKLDVFERFYTKEETKVLWNHWRRKNNILAS